jgi:CelD/BcsL family acetyltransferase involved in cellulose biosynthesis
MEFNGVAADGPFADLLAGELARRPRWACHTQRHERALFRPQAGAETGVSHKHLKELRRVERRLADLGELKYSVFEDGDDLDAWSERFLALEASGWKGAEGTAFQSSAEDRAFFFAITRAAAAQRRLQLLSLDLNGAPIAMKCNFIAGEGSFAFKIAHDESYGRYSPGVLLELFNMQRLQQQTAITWMDSCAAAKHFMINRLWTDRRAIANHLLAGRGLIARAAVRYGPRLRALRRPAANEVTQGNADADHS